MGDLKGEPFQQHVLDLGQWPMENEAMRDPADQAMCCRLTARLVVRYITSWCHLDSPEHEDVDPLDAAMTEKGDPTTRSGCGYTPRGPKRVAPSTYICRAEP